MFENVKIALEECESKKGNKYTRAKVTFADGSYLYCYDFKLIDKLILKEYKK